MLFNQIKTPSDIRMFYESGDPRTGSRDQRHFFDRSSMKFFGDTMKSFGVKRYDGALYLYRKPTATVNVFGNFKTAGREFFNAWRLDETDYDLHGVSEEIEQVLFDLVKR